MSRIASSPIAVPKGVDVTIDGQNVNIKGSKGALAREIHSRVAVELEDGTLKISPRDPSKTTVSLAGTSRALLANMVTGVSSGFERKLQIIGVGYRAQVEGQQLKLSLGFSHPADYQIPEGIAVETPSQTEIVVKGIDKQRVGQVAADIRAYRPPEPYKGKGVRYADEKVRRKEAKKTA